MDEKQSVNGFCVIESSQLPDARHEKTIPILSHDRWSDPANPSTIDNTRKSPLLIASFVPVDILYIELCRLCDRIGSESKHQLVMTDELCLCFSFSALTSERR